MTDTNEFVSIEDVAKHFTVSVSTARSWVRQGELPKNTYVKIGKTYRFKLDAVVQALLGDQTEKKEAKKEPHDSPAPVEEILESFADDDF